MWLSALGLARTAATKVSAVVVPQSYAELDAATAPDHDSDYIGSDDDSENNDEDSDYWCIVY